MSRIKLVDMTQTNLFTHKIAAMQFLSRLLKSTSSFSPHTKVMTIKKALALTSTVSLSVLIAQSANAATLGARASVNLIEMDNETNRSPASGSLVEASASGQGSSGTGFASFDGKVGASAMSENTSPIYNASGSGSFGSGYEVIGNSDNTSLPLSFNFHLSGSLSADSEIGNNTSQGIAGATVGGLLSSGSNVSQINGRANLRSRAGSPISFTQAGVFGSSGSPQVRIQPKINVEADINEVFLNEDDLDELNLEFSLEGEPSDFDFPVLTGLIADAITSQGLSRLNLVPGLDIEAGFKVDYGFDTSFSLPLEVVDRGKINYFINTSANALLEASANSNYSSTLSLTSITVPEEFDAVDVDKLRVVFDSGFELPIQVESYGTGNGNGDVPKSVPEPLTILGSATALGFGALFKREHSRRQKNFK